MAKKSPPSYRLPELEQITTESKALKIEGVVEKITFHNSENGFSVLKVGIKDKNDLVTVVGHVGSVALGESLSATGFWTTNKDYGVQFAADVIHLLPPNSLEEIEKYLASGVIEGIGEHFSKKLVEAFGSEIFDVIENSPKKLLTVENVGQQRLKKIQDSWKEKGFVRKIMVFLQNHGVSPSKSMKIFNKYGECAIELMKSNPYQLCRDIPGIGFKIADQIALRLGLDHQSHLRARAGLNYILSEKSNRGHCAYPREALVSEAGSILNIDRSIISNELEQELKEGFLVAESIEGFDCVYLKVLYKTEQSVASQLKRLKEGVAPWPYPEHLDKNLSKTEKKLKLTLAPLQKLAIHTALTNKISVITGGPGTGKSTLTQALTSYLESLDMRLTLCSPTGRAAKRLSECTHLEAKTIHRTLLFDSDTGNFKYNLLNPLETDFVLIDEASMLDIFLANSLLKAIPDHAALVMVGDVDQLPSVGPGQVLRDVIRSEMAPVVSLKQIFRQAKESQIVQVAHKINEGQMPDLTPHRQSDFFFIEKNTSEEIEKTIVELISRRLPAAYNLNPIHDIQILSPMQKGLAGVKNLNLKVQQVINPQPIAKIEKFGNLYGVGDKVMITENNYDKDVFNGDMGIIETIQLDQQIIKVIIDGRIVEFSFSQLEAVQPAYAITIHKSQGSEYPMVVIPLTVEHLMMMQRNLIYTAITRGKKLVVLVGQPRALHVAVHDFKKRKRWTKLREWLNPI